MRRNILKLLALAPFTLLFASCEKKISHEYKEVHWDRDMCERCKMIISERNHATQVIDKKTGQAYIFDDIGCAILWFKEENIMWKDKASIWISDVKTSKYIDARSAYYDTIHHTPMTYGFSANEKRESIVKNSKILNFEEISKKILQKGR